MTFSVRGDIWYDVDLSWYLTKCKPGWHLMWGYFWLQVNLITVVPNVGIRCFYQGVGGTSGLCEKSCDTWPQDVSAWGQPAGCSTKLGHEMPLMGGWGHIWPNISLLVVTPNLAMRCIYQCGICLHIDIFYLLCVWECLA